MAIAQRFKFIVPPGARPFIKKRFPRLVKGLAIALDSTPDTLDARRWARLLSARTWSRTWNPGPIHHPLARQMWSGFGEETARELEQLKLSEALSRKALASAAWSLTQWYRSQGEYAKALDNLILMTMAIPRLRRNIITQFTMVECMLQLGRPEDAERWLEWASFGTKNPRAEFYFSTANICHARSSQNGHDASDAQRLELINKAFESAGFSKIGKRDENAPLTLDNLVVQSPRPADASAKLSVLMPAYNCADTLPIALTSVLNQTWRNLEVIVVDDCSPDATWSVIERFAQLDNRIVPVRHERNGGAYAARNTALARATGEFVTVHDADDWSHPEKFAAQMLYALSQPDGISTTMGVRVSRDLRFGVTSITGGMMMQNISSLLMKRQILVDVGGWDRTRVAADSELYERIRAKHSLETNKLFNTTPLTFILYSGSSLTQLSAAGISTVQYGARRQYKEAYRFWHATELARSNPDFRMSEDRRFPAPRVLLKRNEPITDIDVIITGNLSDIERSFESDIARWKALANAGLKLGLVHWPIHNQFDRDIVPIVRSAIASGLVENIVPGETVHCRAAVALGAELIKKPPSPLPTINAERLYVLRGRHHMANEKGEAWARFFGANPQTIDGDYLSLLLEVKNKSSGDV